MSPDTSEQAPGGRGADKSAGHRSTQIDGNRRPQSVLPSLATTGPSWSSLQAGKAEQREESTLNRQKNRKSREENTHY